MDGLAHFRPVQCDPWRPRAEACYAAPATGVAALGLSQVLCLLSKGDYSCPCHRADELLMTIISFAQCCSVTLCGQGALGTCLLLPVFPHLHVKKSPGFLHLPQHRHTQYFRVSLGFALAPSQRAAQGRSAQSKAWLSLLDFMLFVLAILCCSW